ncbi:MAG TPA: alpha/beta hydrolase [Thermoplasmata archaeon]|nr:alpha/beta hydrolase [Thermoplasmata archaeon]
MPSAQANGTQLYYELHGTSGDPVVLVHGSWVDHSSWSEVVPGFEQSMQVVAYDRRGHGASPAVPRTRPVHDDAADLAGLLEALDLYPAHVVAHSYGAAVALRLAVDRPEMVRSVVAHEPTYVGLLAGDAATAPEAERLLDGIRALQRLVRAGDVETAAAQFVDQFSSEPGAWDRLPELVRARFRANAPRWVEEFDDPETLSPAPAPLAELLIPVLLTEGSQSPPFLHRITAALARLLRNGQVRELPDVGHVPHLTRPQQFVGVVLTYLLERNVPVT